MGNILKDVYVDLDARTEHFETDRKGTKWLDLSFDASEHHFYNRSSNLGGATVSLETLTKLGLEAAISGSDLQFTDNGPVTNQPTTTYRYIMLADDKPCYLVPTNYKITPFTPPAEAVDYLYVDRSAELDATAAKRIVAYLELSQNTKLVLYLRHLSNPHLNSLIPRADLIFLEETNQLTNLDHLIPPEVQDSTKLIRISDHRLSCQHFSEPLSVDRIDMLTHLSIYSTASATILGCLILGYSNEDSLHLARLNVENSKLNTSLSLEQLESIESDPTPPSNLELIASSLVLHPKGILAADESGGSIHKKFAQLDLPDTYDNRRDYRNMLFTTPNLSEYVNGVILFDETARQTADNGQTFVDYLTSKRIIPGIKVDQGLAPLEPHSLETITNGLDGLDSRLTEYYQMGLRFAKWRAAFNILLGHNNTILTPTDHAIDQNCHILAEYASKCQKAGLVPIVEPEVVYDGYYSAGDSTSVTGKILRALFAALNESHVDLKACILKCNMILAGKHYPTQSTPEEVGRLTAEVLKSNVPADLAGIVFLSGGQTPTQATDNLAAIIKHSPFPWPVTFSFARALQDPALYAWLGDNHNIPSAHAALEERLSANCQALSNQFEN